MSVNFFSGQGSDFFFDKFELNNFLTQYYPIEKQLILPINSISISTDSYNRFSLNQIYTNEFVLSYTFIQIEDQNIIFNYIF